MGVVSFKGLKDLIEAEINRRKNNIIGPEGWINPSQIQKHLVNSINKDISDILNVVRQSKHKDPDTYEKIEQDLIRILRYVNYYDSISKRPS